MRKFISIFLFALLNTLACFSGFGKSNSISKPSLRLSQLLEGSNNERVSAIEQDTHGFIWIDACNGLHRYDGMQFKLYSHSSDFSSVSNSRIGKVYRESKGNLWIGTARGLCRYTWQQDNFSRFSLTSGRVDPTDSSPNKLTAISEDQPWTITCRSLSTVMAILL